MAGEGRFHHALHKHGVEREAVGADEECFGVLLAGGTQALVPVAGDGVAELVAEWDYSLFITLAEHF